MLLSTCRLGTKYGTESNRYCRKLIKSDPKFLAQADKMSSLVKTSRTGESQKVSKLAFNESPKATGDFAEIKISDIIVSLKKLTDKYPLLTKNWTVQGAKKPSLTERVASSEHWESQRTYTTPKTDNKLVVSLSLYSCLWTNYSQQNWVSEN